MQCLYTCKSVQWLTLSKYRFFQKILIFEEVVVKTYFIFQVNTASDGQEGLNIQDQHSMLKNSCNEEIQTSSCSLTLNESLTLKLENFELKNQRFLNLKKNVYSQKT